MKRFISSVVGVALSLSLVAPVNAEEVVTETPADKVVTAEDQSGSSFGSSKDPILWVFGVLVFLAMFSPQFSQTMTYILEPTKNNN